ncbi:UNVERIFIED_CONTAM: hypothetical protein FKN15_074257 [Acipenser sinensis]
MAETKLLLVQSFKKILHLPRNPVSIARMPATAASVPLPWWRRGKEFSEPEDEDEDLEEHRPAPTPKGSLPSSRCVTGSGDSVDRTAGDKWGESCYAGVRDADQSLEQQARLLSSVLLAKCAKDAQELWSLPAPSACSLSQAVDAPVVLIPC